MLGILCGLESEAKIARKIPGALVACAAARPRKGRDLARELIAQGATKLMSFGIAGSLDSTVFLGDVFIATRVASASGQYHCDEDWGRDLAAKIPHAKRGSVYGSESLVATVAEKSTLHQNTGCALVDMESQCVAEAAAEAGIPMITVRAVCDNPHMNVPPFVMAAIGEDGQVKIARAILHLLTHPQEIPDIFEVTRGTAQALKALNAIQPFL